MRGKQMYKGFERDQPNLHMIPEKRLYVLGKRTCGLTSNRTPFSVLTYTARSLPALVSGLSKIDKRA